jgi:hypothetical protein
MQLDDKENADFLAVFYTFLKTGSTSSDALHKTKLHFINKGYPSTMWAAYLYYGNDFYLSKKSNVNIYLYISIAIIAGCLSFLVVKQIKKRK